jgi:hypothetical protein
MFVLPQWGHGTGFLNSFEDKIEWDAKLPLASLLMRLRSKSFTIKQWQPVSAGILPSSPQTASFAASVV